MVAVLSAISVVPISRTPSSKMKFNELQSANRTYVLRYHLIYMTEIPRYLFYLRQSHATRFSGISREKLGKSLLHPQAPSVSYTYAAQTLAIECAITSHTMMVQRHVTASRGPCCNRCDQKHNHCDAHQLLYKKGL